MSFSICCPSVDLGDCWLLLVDTDLGDLEELLRDDGLELLGDCLMLPTGLPCDVRGVSPCVERAVDFPKFEVSRLV